MIKRKNPLKRKAFPSRNKYFALRDEYYSLIDGSDTKAEIHEQAKQKILPLIYDDINCWNIEEVDPNLISTRHLTEEGWKQFTENFEKFFLYNFK